MKVNVERVLGLCDKEKLQQVLGCLSESVLLYVMGVVEFPEIGSYVNIAGEEDYTCEVLVSQVDYLHGKVFVEYKRKATFYVNDEGKEISWKKDGYKPIEKLVDNAYWIDVNRIIIR